MFSKIIGTDVSRLFSGRKTHRITWKKLIYKSKGYSIFAHEAHLEALQFCYFFLFFEVHMHRHLLDKITQNFMHKIFTFAKSADLISGRVLQDRIDCTLWF